MFQVNPVFPIESYLHVLCKSLQPGKLSDIELLRAKIEEKKMELLFLDPAMGPEVNMGTWWG